MLLYGLFWPTPHPSCALSRSFRHIYGHYASPAHPPARSISLPRAANMISARNALPASAPDLVYRRRSTPRCSQRVYSLPDPSLSNTQQHGVPSRSGAEARALQDASIGAAIAVGHSDASFEPTVYEPQQDVELPVDTVQEQSSSVPATRSISQTISEILALSIPALGSTLADPVCSLADTALVGQVSSIQLAALSPCTAIFNLAFLVCYKSSRIPVVLLFLLSAAQDGSDLLTRFVPAPPHGRQHSVESGACKF